MTGAEGAPRLGVDNGEAGRGRRTEQARDIVAGGTAGTGKVAAALAYAARGWSVFRVNHQNKKPLAGSNGLTDATTDPAQIRQWWTARPDCGVAIGTGAGSGIFVLDVDPRHGGDVALEAQELEHGPLDTLEARTGGGGRHLYYRGRRV